MSYLEPDDTHITVGPFANVQALDGLPPILRTGNAIPGGPGPAHRLGVHLSEGCLVTKVVQYTNELAHWVNAARGDPSRARDIVSKSSSSLAVLIPSSQETILSIELRITSYRQGFTLNDQCNLAFRMSAETCVYINYIIMYAALDKYAFIAVTPSLATLADLVTVVKEDNDRRQGILDETGRCPLRQIDVSC
jgi:hypothetical protein